MFATQTSSRRAAISRHNGRAEYARSIHRQARSVFSAMTRPTVDGHSHDRQRRRATALAFQPVNRQRQQHRQEPGPLKCRQRRARNPGRQRLRQDGQRQSVWRSGRAPRQAAPSVRAGLRPARSPSRPRPPATAAAGSRAACSARTEKKTRHEEQPQQQEPAPCIAIERAARQQQQQRASTASARLPHGRVEPEGLAVRQRSSW